MKIKGLILKDWYTLQKNVKITSIIFFIIWLGGIFIDILTPIFFYPCIAGALVGFSLFNLDERGFGKYIFSLPCSAKEVLLSKYILDVGVKILMLVMFLLSITLRSIIFDVPFFSSVSVFALLIILVLYIITLCLLPLYFKLKSKIFIVVCFLIGVLSGGLGIFFLEDKELLTYDGLAPVLTILLCIFLCVIPISYCLSLRQYKRCDF